MRKKLSIIFAIIFIITIIAIVAIKNDNLQEDVQDYTQYPENEIFYSNIYEVQQSLKYNYDFEEQNYKNRVLIKCVDENLQPIKESKVEFYDSEGYIITDLTANEVGEIAINNLENNKTYYFKQTETRNGLVSDDTLYKIEIDYENYGFLQIIISADRILTDKEKEKIKEKYEQIAKKVEKNEDDVTTYQALSDKEKEEKETTLIVPQTYILLKDELAGLRLNITQTARDLRIDDNDILGYTVRISNAYILEYEIETEDNEVSLMNSKKEITNKFYNGEEFYIKPNEGHIGYTKYKLIIKLKYNDKIYKIKKSIYLNNKGIGLGRIELTAFKENTEELSIGEKIRLESVVNATGEKIKVAVAKTGTDGKIQYYSVPVGKYVFTKLVGENEISSEVFEVKRDEMTEVQFK